MEKDGEDQLDRSCKKISGHILRINCLLKQVIEGNMKRKIYGTTRRGRRQKLLLDYLKEKKNTGIGNMKNWSIY
jgi:hypothetical protein